MGSKTFVKLLMGLSEPEVVVQLTGNTKELESVKAGIIESWPLCENVVQFHSHSTYVFFGGGEQR